MGAQNPDLPYSWPKHWVYNYAPCTTSSNAPESTKNLIHRSHTYLQYLLAFRSVTLFRNGRQFFVKRAWANLKIKELFDSSTKIAYFGGKTWLVRWTRSAYFSPIKLASKLLTDSFPLTRNWLSNYRH